jgi:hypothetical protein
MDRIYSLAGPHKVTVTDVSSTLATLGVTLKAGTKHLMIYAETAGIRWNFGVASADTPPVFAGTSQIFGTLAQLQSLQFVAAAGNTVMFVEELG